MDTIYDPEELRRTFDDPYGRHAINDIRNEPQHPYDVWRYINNAGLHGTRVNPEYIARHYRRITHDQQA